MQEVFRGDHMAPSLVCFCSTKRSHEGPSPANPSAHLVSLLGAGFALSRSAAPLNTPSACASPPCASSRCDPANGGSTTEDAAAEVSALSPLLSRPSDWAAPTWQ